MDEPDDPWLQRLRDGVVPSARWMFVTLGALTAAGALLVWAEALHLEWVGDFWEHTRRIGILVLVLTGPAGRGARYRCSPRGGQSRRDRRVLARIRPARAARSRSTCR